MNFIRNTVIALLMLCGGCTSLGLDKTPLLAMKVDESVSLKLTAGDAATFSKIHDVALSQCIFRQNNKNNLITFGSITVSNTDLVLAAVAPIAALTGKVGTTTLIAGASTILAGQLKSLIWPATANDFTPITNGMDYIYATYLNSPGIASMMNDVTVGQPQRAYAIKEFEYALEQVCSSSMKFPPPAANAYTAIFLPANPTPVPVVPK